MAISIRERVDHWPSETERAYDVFFYSDAIFTTVTYYPNAVATWISEVESEHPEPRIIGLAVNLEPQLSGDHQDRVATLQLSIGSRCLIYHIGCRVYAGERELAHFLSDDDNIFVGVDVESNLEKLEKCYGMGEDARCVDLGSLVVGRLGWNELKNAELKKLADIVLGKEVPPPPPPEEVSEWSWIDRDLEEDQVMYACVDAFVSYEIGKLLNAADFDSS